MSLYIRVEKTAQDQWQANFVDVPQVRCVGAIPKLAIEQLVTNFPERRNDLHTIVSRDPEDDCRLNFMVEAVS